MSDRLKLRLFAIVAVNALASHLAELAKAFPPGISAGERCPEAQLVHMDSERKLTA
jgi:hypothetical protein